MKKIFILLLAAALAVSMASCGKKEEEKKTDSTKTETQTPADTKNEENKNSSAEAVAKKVEEFLAKEIPAEPEKEENAETDTTPITGIEIPYQYDLAPYITIEKDDYVGIELTAMSAEVTAEDLEEAVLTDLENYGTETDVTDRGAEMGDSINIDFEGFESGVAFDRGKAEGYDMVLGEAGFIDGFEDQLVGHKVGEEFTIDVVFPEDYDEALAGKPAQFKIKMNSIKSVSVPELTDEFAKTNFYCETVDDYLLQKYREVLKNNTMNVENATKSLAYTTVYENVTINSLPEDMFNYYVDKINSDNEEMAKAYGMTLDQLLEASGMTKEDLEQYSKDQATAIVEQELVAFAIAKNEGLLENITRGELDAYIATLAESYGATPEQFKEDYPESMLFNSLILEKVIMFVIDNAVTK